MNPRQAPSRAAKAFLVEQEEVERQVILEPPVEHQVGAAVRLMEALLEAAKKVEELVEHRAAPALLEEVRLVEECLEEVNLAAALLEVAK